MSNDALKIYYKYILNELQHCKRRHYDDFSEERIAELAHLNLPRLTREHFDRWLEMWRQTAGELCTAPAAAQFINKAEMIAERLLGTISLYHQPHAAAETSLSSSH